ncbi:hypothetical protein [Streptomyces sp. NPDC056527]|uniref:hypothetical protein n=1 Tax=Streptomyces sp. NPDC056527 TaxID=3345853 RepID=UPI0036C77AE3
MIPGATGEPVTHRNWTDEWVAVRCVSCGREDEWPHPELGCTCGTVLRVPVREAGVGDGGSLPGIPGPARALPEQPGPDPKGERRTDRATTDAPPGPLGSDTRTGPGSRPDGTDTGPRAETRAGDPPGTRADEGTDGPAPGAAPGPQAAGTDDTAPTTGIWTGDAPEDDLQDGPEGDLHDVARHGLGAGRSRAFTERYPAHIPLPPTAPRPAAPRPSFRPVTIRTARDAVAASAGYLRWLGFRNVVQPEERSASGVDLRAPGLVAQVDPSTRPAALRAVECLWLNGLSNSSLSVFFSLAGYTPEARSRADELGIPLFVLDLTGTPQPVNTPADELITTGA